MKNFEVPIKSGNECKAWILRLIDSKITVTIFFVFTLFALFSDDIRNLSVKADSDNWFFGITSVIFVCFCSEIVVCSVVKQDYLFSFYFWLDLIGTVSLVPDIGWIYDLMIGINANGNMTSLNNSGAASRAGTRSTRIVRIIRLVRLIRIAKLYKSALLAFDSHISSNEETKVGKMLTEKIIKKVILTILVILIILPFLDDQFYLNYYHSWDFGTYELQEFLTLDTFEIVLNDFVAYHKNSVRPLIYLEYLNATGDFIWNESESYSNFRYYELYVASTDNITAIFNIKIDTMLDSGLSICRTVYICFILILAALTFYRDADHLIIRPIEKLLMTVSLINLNPLHPNFIHSVTLPSKSSCSCFQLKIEEAEYETSIIKTSIEKISVLLALGFGEAGSQIISSNLGKSSKLNIFLSGNKIVGIFAFCDIRNFTDTTEELQENIMVFVNEIARIVHGTVDKYLGAANKNIGDAFLLVWKFDDDDFCIEGDKIVKNPESVKARAYPDLALLSIIKILVKINRDSNILAYRTHPKLLKRLPNYSVKLGFGVHIGWAIEGTLGSNYKIDVSYLSHHVNLASKLEAATKVYGVSLLMSGKFFDHLTAKVQLCCRQVDRGLLASGKFLSVFTFDGNYSEMNPSFQKPLSKAFCNNLKMQLQGKIFNQGLLISNLFENSKTIANIRQGYTEEFFRCYNHGFRLFKKNRWVDSKSYFEACLKIIPNDGPSKYILNVLQKNNYAPYPRVLDV